MPTVEEEDVSIILGVGVVDAPPPVNALPAAPSSCDSDDGPAPSALPASLEATVVGVSDKLPDVASAATQKSATIAVMPTVVPIAMRSRT